jgi:hypothetical protein
MEGVPLLQVADWRGDAVAVVTGVDGDVTVYDVAIVGEDVALTPTTGGEDVDVDEDGKSLVVAVNLVVGSGDVGRRREGAVDAFPIESKSKSTFFGAYWCSLTVDG